MARPHSIEVTRQDIGKTVAAVIKARLGLSWSHVNRLIERHHVRYAGQVIGDPAHRVKFGQRITIAAGALPGDSTRAAQKAAPAPKPPRAPREAAPRPESAHAKEPHAPESPPQDIDILYVDESLVVVNKPAGLTTMRHEEEAAEFGERSRRFLPKTLADWLPGLLGVPNRPVHAVHRLDRDTTGVLVFARTPAAAQTLTTQFRKHTVERRYLALVRGTAQAGRIESVLVPDRGDGRRGSSTTPGATGQRAVTHVQVLEQVEGYALVQCRLETGRTHQVRIHLGEAGTALCGERVYDRPVHGVPSADGSGAERPMLHARRLGLAHPETGERLTWDVPPPEDFRELCAKLGLEKGLRQESDS